MRIPQLAFSTCTALYAYGGRNVYKRGPLIDLRTTRLPFEPAANLEAVRRVR